MENQNIKKPISPFLLEQEKKRQEENKVNIPSIPLEEKELPKTEPVVEQVKVPEITPVEPTIIPVKDTKKDTIIIGGNEKTATTTTTTTTTTEVEPTIIEVTPVVIPTEEQVHVEQVPVKQKPLEEIVPLSKEELTHLAIIEEIKEYLDDDLKEINELAYKIKVLKEQEEDEVLLKEQEEIKRQLELLIQRIEELRKKYEELYVKIKAKDISLIDNDVLEISIKDYIEDTKEGQDTSQYFDQIVEVSYYLDLLNKIIEVDQAKDELSVEVDQKIDRFEERDQDFEEAQDQAVDIDKINYDIKLYNETVSKALEQIEREMHSSTEVSRRVETTTNRAINFGRIIAATIMLAESPRIPPTPTGSLLRGGLVGLAIHLLLHATYNETTTRRITTITYKDFKQDILKGQEIITQSLKLIGTSYEELEEIKKKFDEEFSEYANQIPEYAKLIKDLIDLEKELQRQEEQAYRYQKQLDEQLVENETKVKKIEEITD